MNTADADVERYLKLFTLLDLKKIDEIVLEHKKAPEGRHGQKYLAHYVTETIFGGKARDVAMRISTLLF